MPFQMCTTHYNNKDKITVRRDSPNTIHIGFSSKEKYSYICITNNQAKRILKKLKEVE